MSELDQYRKPPNQTGKPVHEIDSLLNRGGLVGAVRSLIAGAIKYKVMVLIASLALAGLGIGAVSSERIAKKFANYNFFDGIKELKAVKTTMLDQHPIYKSKLAAEFHASRDMTLKKASSYVREAKIDSRGELLLDKDGKPILVDLLISVKNYKKMHFSTYIEDSAKDACEMDYLYDSYPVHVKEKNRLNDDGWKGEKKFYCVYNITENYKGDK